VSFEVYLQCFANGEPAGVSRAALADLFAIDRVQRHNDEWEADYGDCGCDIMVVPLDQDDELIHQITIERPCQDMRLWESVYRTMTLGSVILYFPGDVAPLAVNDTVGGNMPQDLREALGEPVIISGPEEIVAYIESA
jgi:hypothetical protein